MYVYLMRSLIVSPVVIQPFASVFPLFRLYDGFIDEANSRKKTLRIIALSNLCGYE